jgi:hypothetical protein
MRSNSAPVGDKEESAAPQEQAMPLPLAAAQLRLSRAMAYNAVLTGRLDGVRIKGRWYVTVTSVERASRTEASSPTSLAPASRHTGRE